jgi:hypothetical protein
MDANFTLTGTDNLLKIFREYPEMGYRKPVIAGFRQAAIPVKKAMISNLPSALSPLKKIIKIKPGRGKSMTLAVGAYGRQGMYRNSKGQMWDPWQILYWHNYGTLSRRAASHTFITPRKKVSMNRSGGIAPGLFFEKAWEQSQGEAQKKFEETVDKEVMKFLEKNAAK